MLDMLVILVMLIIVYIIRIALSSFGMTVFNTKLTYLWKLVQWH